MWYIDYLMVQERQRDIQRDVGASQLRTSLRRRQRDLRSRGAELNRTKQIGAWQRLLMVFQVS